jgi:small-conductance mechanosensitive channel
MAWDEILDIGHGILEEKIVSLAGANITVGSAIMALLTVLLTIFFSSLVKRLVTHSLKKRGMGSEGTTIIIARLIHYIIMGIGIGVAVQVLGIDIGTFFAAGAIFAVGLGFAMQSIIQNFASGLILLIERVIKPDDVLEVEGKIVKVTRMGIRAAVVRSLDGEDLIVPNSVLVQSTIKNYTMHDSTYRLRIPVGVVYASDMKLVRQTLEETAASLEWHAEGHAPLVLMTGFGSSSVDFEVSVWIDDPWKKRRATSDIVQAIWWALKDKGITIAFPQVDVHFDPPVLDGLGRIGSRAA